jgi:hypothetical protein
MNLVRSAHNWNDGIISIFVEFQRHLIKDPEPSEEIKPFKEKQLFGGHLVG